MSVLNARIAIPKERRVIMTLEEYRESVLATREASKALALSLLVKAGAK